MTARPWLMFWLMVDRMRKLSSSRVAVNIIQSDLTFRRAGVHMTSPSTFLAKDRAAGAHKSDF